MTAPLTATARGHLYALAARLFATEVDRTLYRTLLAQDSVGLLDASLRAMDEAQALDILAVEFCRLFVGPQPVCTPYASAQRGEALLGGRAQQRLEAFLERHGLTYDLRAWRLASPDHLALLLATLAHLYASGESAAAHELLTVHLLSWVPTYCQHVAAATHLSLYRTAAELVHTLLTAE
jgi:TorA maturation chaperone TorD